MPFAERTPVVPPRNHTLVVSGQGAGTDRGSITAFIPGGWLRYYDDSHVEYFDVDPSPEGRRTVLYTANAGGGEGGDECDVSVVERVNLTTGEVTRLYAETTTLTWHDADRVNDTHYLVADMARDTVFLVDVPTGLVTWQWRAQSAFPPDDRRVVPRGLDARQRRHLAERHRHGVGAKPDQVVFVRPNGSVDVDRTLGCEDCHGTLYEPHNPDYIPESRGGPAVVVADSENDRLVKYQRRNGAWEWTWVWSDSRLSWPRDVDRLPDGRMLVTDTHGERVFVVNRTGGIEWSAELINGYDAELLSTGDESAGGRSAAALDYRPYDGVADAGLAPDDLPKSVLPAKVRHAVVFVAPWYWGGDRGRLGGGRGGAPALLGRARTVLDPPSGVRRRRAGWRIVDGPRSALRGSDGGPWRAPDTPRARRGRRRPGDGRGGFMCWSRQGTRVIAAALLAGGAVGLKHAFEADHVAAVATLVEDAERPASTGAAWGIGHSLPVLAAGVLALALGLRLPGAVAAGVEAVVAVVLVALGLRAVAGREALGTAVLRHVHGRDGADGHAHLAVGGREIGLTHSHADEESFAVGIVHGLAGSGGVVVALAATAPTATDGAAFLAGFAAATVGAMALATWGWGRAVGRAGALRTVAGVASVAVGLLLVVDLLGIGGAPIAVPP